MDIQKIKELALANGFSLKEQASGNMDLHSYVYEFANAIEQAVKTQAAPEGFVLVPKDKISHFYQDNDEPENFCNSSNDWDCLGEGMDIQKEKIAHEKHLLSQGVDFKYLPNIQYSELENVYELIEWDEEYSEALNEINSSWCTWQAAKAQAVLEGFVLVPKQPTPKMIDATWNFDEEIQDMSHNSRNEFIYNAMIAAAQEPTA